MRLGSNSVEIILGISAISIEIVDLISVDKKAIFEFKKNPIWHFSNFRPNGSTKTNQRSAEVLMS